ncbi:hypothetical protein FQB35_06725 [Crassaminicella thermophila]|uniref:Uncharacterized protein n=1 Tax=Crassaminicella thermophila TaxID=2599308 RepID=A0A5C0SDQ7_CRATE|nr:hypothetical protein [Crassaminicella thermophila]QEK12092.1 hypothetical protein FQB35_06725 [Crassaminicella thermophila]
MSINKTTNILLYTNNDIMHFSSDSHIGINYFINNEKIQVCNNDILEFDIDIDSNGNIGMIVLDCNGKFIYYYYDGEIWTSHLLYEVDIHLEIFKHISIKFLFDSPYILFCWHNLSDPNLWSIVSYYKENDNWKKKVLNRIYLKKNIKPYILIKDIHSHLYLIYLSNNNMIYDLLMITLTTKSYEWTHPVFLCNSIFLNYFYLDAIIDIDGLVHISWIDKHKKNYCVKYIYYNSKKNTTSNLTKIFEMDTPFIRHQFFYQDNLMICYGITKKHIYYSAKTTNITNSYSTWTNSETLKLFSDSIHLVKIVQPTNNSFVKYNANYILSESLANITPITIQVTKHPLYNKETNQNFSMTSRNNNLNKNEILSTDKNNISIDSIKKLKLELYKKNQELVMKNNLLKSLESNISYLKEEVKRLNLQNKNYINTIYKNNEKNTSYKNNIEKLKKDYDKILSDYKLSELKNKDLLNKIQIYQTQLEKLKLDIEELYTQNNILKKEIENLKNMSLFKRLF